MLAIPVSPVAKAEVQENPQQSPHQNLQQNPQQNPTFLDLFSNWNHFNRQAMAFFDSQRALLALCIKNLPVDRLNGLLELDLINHTLTYSALNKVKEMAAQLEGVHNKILSQKLALQTEEIRQLQDEIEKLKQEAAEFPFNVDMSDQSELADRLEAQTACLNEKDRKITELLDRLNTQERCTGDGWSYNKVEEDVADFTFHELREKEVARLEPRDLIDHIRRELGVGTEHLSAAQRRIFRAMRGKLGSALEKLAHDIYSNDSQIVLEIIQNADDNYYDGVEPLLSIKVCAEKYMFVTNNEVGFTNENVVAISNVGSSTKKDANRFTGHKGIGFKSVFKVTRTPYIISRDFCFRFNLDSEHTEENVGYILPEWVEKKEAEAAVSPEAIDDKMTHFFFPFSPSSRFPAEELYEGIDFIALFLRQLHTIELALDNKKKVVTISKDHHSDPSGLLETLRLTVVEHTTLLESGEISQATLRQVVYRVYRKTLDVPKDLQVSQVGRTPPTKTELILAFPVLDDPQPDLQTVEIQKVYSYLPVETAGFRFIIQADFHLVSSRDRVHTQDLYNRWLACMIPVAFQEAFGLGDDSGPQNSVLRDDMFTFLPTKEELARTGQSESSTDGFWRRAMKGIRDRVMDTPCILTETARWAKPDEVYIRPRGFENLFTNDELRTALQKEFVCQRMAAVAVCGLGCQFLSPAAVVAILNHPEFSASKKEPSWFYQLYRFFGSQLRGVGELLDQIFEAKMFPLDSGAVTSLKEGRIFLLKSAPVYRIGAQVLRLLALDWTLLPPDDLAYQFLETVGISSATPLDIADSILIYHFCLPRPVSRLPAITALITTDHLWEQLRFLKENWLDVGKVFPRIETGLLVPVQPPQSMPSSGATEDMAAPPEAVQCYYHFPKFVYLPSLRNTFNEIHPALIDSAVLLDDSILQTETLQQDIEKEWQQFLTVKLGVNKSLRLRQTCDKIYEPSDELNLALEIAGAEATLRLPARWRVLLHHLQTNWKYLQQSKSLIRHIKNSRSGYDNLLISELFPDLRQYRSLLLDSNGQPCMDFPAFEGLVDEGMLTDLGIDTHVTVKGLQKLDKLLQCPSSLHKEPVRDLAVWNKLYALMKKSSTKPDAVFVQGITDEAGPFVKCIKICVNVPPIFHDWIDLVQFPAADYPGVPNMKEWFKNAPHMRDLTKVLLSILQTEKPNKEEQKEVILECYQRMDALLAGSSNKHQIFLVLDRVYLLRGKKSAHFLVMPDRLDMYHKFLIDPKCFCPIMFVHPELAKLQHVVAALSSLNIPLLSKIVRICPVTTSWRGYYVFPPGTTNIEVPTFVSASLTNLYRALLAEFMFYSSKTLKETEKLNLGNLMRATTVYVCGMECPQVPIAYTIYGISRVFPEDYFIHTTPDGQKQIIVPPGTLFQPLEDQVNLFALQNLFPALVIDQYLKTVIRRMINGDLKHKLEPQYVLTCNDEQKIFNFEIAVEESEAVLKAQEYRKSSRGSSMPYQKKYPIYHIAPRRTDARGIPGLTHQNPPPSLPRFPDSDMPPMKGAKLISQTSLKSQRLFPPSRDSASNPPLPKLLNDHAPEVPRKQEEMTFFNSSITPFPDKTHENTIFPPLPQIKPELMTCARDRDNRSVISAQPSLPTATLTSSTVTDTKASLPMGTADKTPVPLIDTPVVDSRNVLQKMRTEIRSWSQNSVQEIESRLLSKGKLEYNFFVHSGSSLNSDYLQSVRQLENEVEFSKWIGIWAERIAFIHLLDLCRSKKPLLQGAKYVCYPPQNFTSENWVSSARQYFEREPCSCDDTKGYDFSYRQSNGLMVYIEVKGHTTYANSFLLSANEWEVAKRISGERNQVYVVLGINLNAVAMAGAQITYLLEDPIALEEHGTIVHRPFNYLVEIILPVSQSAQVEQRGACSSQSSDASPARTGNIPQVSHAKVKDHHKRPYPGRKSSSKPKKGKGGSP